MRERLITMAEAARRLEVSHEAIRDRVARKTLRHKTIKRGIRSLIRIPESALLDEQKKCGRPKKSLGDRRDAS